MEKARRRRDENEARFLIESLARNVGHCVPRDELKSVVVDGNAPSQFLLCETYGCL